MHIPNLEVPPQIDDVSNIDIRPVAVIEWVERLPLGSPGTAAADVLDKLKKINRIKIPRGKRLQILELLQPVITKLTTILKKDLMQTALPLSPKMAEKASLVSALAIEMAHGYKSIVMDLLLTEQQITDSEQVLIPAIYHAIDYLAQQLVQCYTVYSPEPPKTWYQIHQLYFCAESCSIASIALKKIDSPEIQQKNIDTLYRRIILLGIANPYHLLPGEVAKNWSMLERWAHHCNVTRLAPNSLPVQCFIVNLNHDSAPIYSSIDHPAEKALEVRVLDTKAVVAALKNEVKLHILNKVWDHDKKQTTLSQRALRTMYQRLVKVLNEHRERKFERLPVSDKAMMAAGLTASHFLANRGRIFDPEKDEIELRTRLSQANSALQLLPESDHSTWNEIFDPANLEGHKNKHYARFEKGDRTTGENDVWEKVYSSTVYWAQQHNQQASDPTARKTSCKIKNASKGGIALFFCQNIEKIQVRVGELVALKIAPSDTEETNISSISHWDIGAIKWLRIFPDKGGLELGIEKICSNPLPISVKAVQGVGQGSEYTRGLLLTAEAAENGEHILITSPSIYDHGSVLLLNLGHKFMRVRLSRVLEETTSFARFSCKKLNELG